MDKIILSSVPMVELLTEFRRVVRTELDAREERVLLPREELLTRAQTAHLLGITLPTLREYTSKGLVTGYRLGSRVRYKRTEVLASLQKISTQIKKLRNGTCSS